jgi:hypothetical protein
MTPLENILIINSDYDKLCMQSDKELMPILASVGHDLGLSHTNPSHIPLLREMVELLIKHKLN